MSTNYPHQLEIEFTPHLKSDETIAALGLFKKDPSTSQLFLTRGIARFTAREFHAAVTNQRLIILPIYHVNGEKFSASPLEAAFANSEIDENIFNEPVLIIHTEALEKPITLRFKAQMQALGMDKYDFIAALKQCQAA